MAEEWMHSLDGLPKLRAWLEGKHHPAAAPGEFAKVRERLEEEKRQVASPDELAEIRAWLQDHNLDGEDIRNVIRALHGLHKARLYNESVAVWSQLTGRYPLQLSEDTFDQMAKAYEDWARSTARPGRRLVVEEPECLDKLDAGAIT